MKESIVSINGLNLWYWDKQALFDIDAEFRKNSITALIGPSGCGKSTLLRSINRMNELIPECRTEGSIKINGTEIIGSDIDVNKLRNRVGMVFQKANPFPMSIRDNVAYGPRIHGVTDKNELDCIVMESLKKAALWDEVRDDLGKSAIKLSGGQQQRLCIARTLAISPDVILMDEPTSALDPIATKKIEELAISLKKDYTIIIVTHNMQQAARISDMTGFMYMGKMAEFDRTEKIFSDPENPLTERYVTGRFG